MTDASEPELCPIWTVDGSKIMYLLTRVAWNYRESYIMNSDESDEHQVGTSYNIGDIDWTPDGSKIIYSASNFL